MELEVYWLDLAEHKLVAIYEYYSIKANKKIAEKLITGSQYDYWNRKST
ncbi:hypothetical protein [Flavobacterium sp. CS20]|jgi:hypothetical protein|nr:hypothetical protein [Flavobacterium sp. CS20]QTY27789.1 hypothetical protein IGB25_04510 [Flavobacterium sp. CS20]